MNRLPFLFMTLAGLLIGCNKSPAPETGQPVNPPAQNASANVDKSTLGTIAGTVSFKGPAPRLPPLDLSADPACPSDPQPQDVIVIKNGKLANVFVYIQSGLAQAAFAAPRDPVVLDQKGCRYIPHVLGLMIGQPLKVLNDDLAEHNVHPMPKQNQEWNESQMPRGQPIVKTFQHPEIMMPVQCNQHPWMEMYLNVMANPFFAVSGEDGSFQIKDLPPGEYTLAAIHEKFGEQKLKVTVAAKQVSTANFNFTGAQKN
jgi:hypothetical protein